MAKTKILDSVGTDYRYRAIFPKKEWAIMLSELAMEQVWSNVKNEAAKYARSGGESSEYVNARHDAWDVMWKLQK